MKLTLLLLSVQTVMAAAIVAPSLPDIAEVFQHTPNAALLSKLIVSIPTLFIALIAPLVGRYIDKSGRLRLLYGGLILYAVSGTSGAYLDNIYYIIMGRALLGIAIGAIMTVTATLIGDYFEGDERKDFIGMQTAVIGFGGAAFLLLGGALAHVSWRLPFLVYILSAFLIPLVVIYIREPTTTHRITPRPSERPSGLLQIIFVTATAIMILFFILPTQLPFLLDEAGLQENVSAGLALAVNALGMVVSSLYYTQLKKRGQFPAIYAAGFLLMAIAYGVAGSTHAYAVILGAMFVAGLGFGIIMANTNLWVIDITRSAFRGRNMGALTTYLFLGQFLSPILCEPLVRWLGISTLFVSAAALMLIIALSFVWSGASLMRMDHAARAAQ